MAVLHKLFKLKLKKKKNTYWDISSKRAVLSLGLFIAIDSTAPWNTKKFLAFTLMPKLSSRLV